MKNRATTRLLKVVNILKLVSENCGVPTLHCNSIPMIAEMAMNPLNR